MALVTLRALCLHGTAINLLLSFYAQVLIGRRVSYYIRVGIYIGVAPGLMLLQEVYLLDTGISHYRMGSGFYLFRTRWTGNRQMARRERESHRRTASN